MNPIKLAPLKQWEERYEVQSTTGESTYIVAKKADGTWGCSCPAWTFHKAPKADCKHIIAMLSATNLVRRFPVQKLRPVEEFANKYQRMNPPPPIFASRDVREWALEFAEQFARSRGATDVEVATESESDVVGEANGFRITRKFRLQT